MSADCLFCKIAKGDIPTPKVFENEKVVAFKDLHPHSAKHFLFIHKNHTKDVNDMMSAEPTQAQDIFQAISEFTKSEGLLNDGYRVVTNVGAHGGQTIFHTHFHLLGGERLGKFGR